MTKSKIAHFVRFESWHFFNWLVSVHFSLRAVSGKRTEVFGFQILDNTIPNLYCVSTTYLMDLLHLRLARVSQSYLDFGSFLFPPKLPPPGLEKLGPYIHIW